MKYVHLKDVCKITMGQSPESSSYNGEKKGMPFFQGNADFGEIYPKVRVWCDAPKKRADKNDILISVRAPIGALNYAKEECCIGRGLAAIKPLEEVNLKYIFYLLKSQYKELNRKGTGSTFKAIGKNVLEDILVPILEKDIQDRYVRRLELIEDVIQKEKEELEELDTLIKSRFVEMFGDVFTNSMEWNKKPLADECDIVTGNTPSRKVSEYYGDYIEWIKSDNINTPNAILTTAEEYLSEEGLKVGRSVDAGSILMTCIAGSIGCIGNVAIADRTVSFNQQINGIVPKENNTWFMYVLFELSKQRIQSTINMALKGILSKGQLSEMEFIFPPVELQNEFGAFVHQVDKLKFSSLPLHK